MNTALYNYLEVPTLHNKEETTIKIPMEKLEPGDLPNWGIRIGGITDHLSFRGQKGYAPLLGFYKTSRVQTFQKPGTERATGNLSHSPVYLALDNQAFVLLLEEKLNNKTILPKIELTRFDDRNKIVEKRQNITFGDCLVQATYHLIDYVIIEINITHKTNTYKETGPNQGILESKADYSMNVR